MKRRNIYEMNYARLRDLLGQAPEKIAPGTTCRLHTHGFMDLVVEKLSRSSTSGAILLSMAHYFDENGDLCPDPEMVVRILPSGDEASQEYAPSTDVRHSRLEALLFQQTNPPVFRAVYSKAGSYSPNAKLELNYFLAFWLRSLKKQGHQLRD